MQQFGTIVRLLGALIPIAYCGGLAWYFIDMGGLDNEFISSELSPTIYGLMFVGLLFVIGFGFQLRKAFRSPPSDDGSSPKRSSLFDEDDTENRPDADAMIARYLAQREAAGPAAPLATGLAATFGRRAQRPT